MEFLPPVYQALGALIRPVTRVVTVNGLSFTLIDVKVAAHFDDPAYEKHESLRRLVPRGLCFVVLDGKILHVLAGSRKFGEFENKMYAHEGKVTHHVFT